MQLLNPIWLWGLLGLSIPIAIHLLSRKEGTVIKIGSIRHLDDTTTLRFKSLRLNEYMLLALRCLLITLLVLFFSGLNFPGLQKKDNWLLVERGIEKEKTLSSLIDSLTKKGFLLKSFSNGFADVQENISTEKINYWNLVEKLKMESIDQAVVLSYNYAKGFKGKRPSLPNHVRWISESPDSVAFVLYGIRLSPDSRLVRRGKSSANKTSYSYENVSNDIKMITDENQSDEEYIASPATISVNIFNDTTFEHDAKIMIAALHAIDKIHPDSIIIKAYPISQYTADTKTDWTIVLSEKTFSVKNSNSIAFTKNLFTEQLLVKTSTNDEHASWALTQRLTRGIALQKNLAVQLAGILMPEEKYAGRSAQLDKRILSDGLMWATKNSDAQLASAQTDITQSQKYVIIFFLAFFLIERGLSFKRSQ